MIIKEYPSISDIDGKTYLFGHYTTVCAIDGPSFDLLKKYLSNHFSSEIDGNSGMDYSQLLPWKLGVTWSDRIVFEGDGYIIHGKTDTMIKYELVEGIISYNITPIIDHIMKHRDAQIKYEREENLRTESRKFSTLYISGKLGEIGYPSESITFENLNTTTKVFIPVDRKSVVTKSYIKIDIRKTKTIKFDVDGKTKVNLTFVKETTNRKDKIVPFENIKLDDAITILESFKKVYFKDNYDNDTE